MSAITDIRYLLSFLRPSFAIVQPWLGIIALFDAHACFRFTGKSPAIAAVIKSSFFAAGLDCAFAAPERLFHINAALAVYGGFSFAFITIRSAS